MGEKLSYDQLKDVNVQLTEQLEKVNGQNKQLVEYTEKIKEEARRKIEELNMANIIQRLEFLFKVIKYSGSFDEEFVKMCKNEIQDIMTLKKEENESK